MEVEVQTSFPEDDDGHPGAKIHRTFVTLEGIPRKKLSSSSEAEKKLQRAILEASAELSNDFHTTYLDKIVKENLGQGILEVQQPDTSYETLKKGFLFYLNGTGKYLVLREHLREAVLGLLHQKSVINYANGFKTKQQYQSFLHDSYSHMLDSLNDAIHSTAYEESPGNRILKCVTNDKSKDSRRTKRLRDLLLFAQEAFAQSDYENAHRLHTERIAGSEDADDCWIDFAIMWLARGDDRLAEIAVREALTKNPMNQVGLLIAGLIAARHRDELGISYLEKVLKQRPMCPEIHVIIATVHAHMGNQGAAEVYYETARKIHKALTPPVQMNKLQEQKPEDGGEKKKKSTEGRGSDETGKGKKESKRESVESKKSSKESKRKTEGGKKNSQGTGEGESSGRRLSRRSDGDAAAAAEIERSSRKSEDIGIKITMENFGETKPPVLSECLVVTWNVTKKPKEKLMPPEFGEVEGQHPPVDGETVDEVQKKFDSIVETSPSSNENVPIPKPLSPENEEHHEHRHRLHSHHHHHRHHKKLAADAPKRYTIFEDDPVPVNVTTEFPGEGDPIPPQVTPPPPPPPPEIKLGKSGNETSSGPIYSQRFGSEFLWTAHLLLKLRQFEFLDLILAKEISRSPERSTEYLYLRAVSLHLRGRDTEALEVIGEELKRNPGNNTFWVLQGHAYYNLRDKEAALGSYERAMMLPRGKESFHLAYIRFGTLCIEKGKLEMAKRIFLKRVDVTPSPYLWISIGNACFALGELANAQHAFTEGNKLDNTNPVIWAHLSLVSLTLGNRNLAEQSYKWAIRFGLKKGKLLDDITDLHRKLGYGNPAFLRNPDCLPHEVFLQRLGRETPLELYAEALTFPHLKPRPSSQNRNEEDELIRKLRDKDAGRQQLRVNEGDGGGAGPMPEDDAVTRRIPSNVIVSIMSLKSKKNMAAKKWRHKSKPAMQRRKSQRL